MFIFIQRQYCPSELFSYSRQYEGKCPHCSTLRRMWWHNTSALTSAPILQRFFSLLLLITWTSHSQGLVKSRADLSGKRRGCSGWAKEIRANKVSTSHPGCLLSFYRPYFHLRLPAAEVFSHLLSPLYDTAKSLEELLTRYDWKICSSWTHVHTEHVQSRRRERRFFKQSYLKLGLD